jgi:hypothetical protein
MAKPKSRLSRIAVIATQTCSVASALASDCGEYAQLFAEQSDGQIAGVAHAAFELKSFSASG